MYIFLTERAHALRAPYLRRSRDWIWVLSMAVIALGFGSITVVAFMYPVVDISTIDGKCRIGLPIRATISLLVFDVFINCVLTAVFIHLLRPILRFGGNLRTEASSVPVERSRFKSFLLRILLLKQRGGLAQELSSSPPLNNSLLDAVERLIWKSLIGACLVLLPTVVNLCLLYHLQGREQGWLCFTICMLDGKIARSACSRVDC